MQEYAETETSRRIRTLLEEDVQRGRLRPDIKLAYKPDLRGRLSKPTGELDVAAIYKELDINFMASDLMLKTVWLNLTDQELREIIEERFRQCYGDSDGEFMQSVVSSRYPIWCRDFGIEPRADFRV